MSIRALAPLLLLTACNAMPATDAGLDANTDAPPRERTVGPAERPARLTLPRDADGSPRALFVLLHGYGANARLQDAYLGLSEEARDRGAYTLLPDGTVDASGARFWSSGGACCDFLGTSVDDVGYLTALIDEVEAAVPVDPDRIYFVGHSNGGFMSYRMACELGDRVAAIAVLAGSDYAEATGCVPTGAVPSVLHLHGTADETILYEGGALGSGTYPGAVDVVERWAGRMGCDVASPTTGELLDLTTQGLAGAETTPTRYTTGCDAGRTAELLTMDGAQHIPELVQPFFIDTVVDWLIAHPR